MLASYYKHFPKSAYNFLGEGDSFIHSFRSLLEGLRVRHSIRLHAHNRTFSHANHDYISCQSAMAQDERRSHRDAALREFNELAQELEVSSVPLHAKLLEASAAQPPKAA